MKTKHTAETLKYYLGREVYLSKKLTYGTEDYKVVSDKGIFKLIRLSTDGDTKILGEKCIVKYENKKEIGDLYVRHEDIYPILKTAKDYKKDAGMEEGRTLTDDFEYKFVEWDYPHSATIKPLRPDQLARFINSGYGAIPYEHSPTGYVDLFGNPCVTPKQVEEGI